MSGPSDILLFCGRLHPLLVHLPIGLIVLLAALEAMARFPRFKHANVNSGLILALALPLSICTALCGWFLSLGGGYDDRLLQWHKWTGIVTAAACLVAAVCYWLNRARLYRLCLAASFGVLVVASHFGGSLTHGSDYLTRYAFGPLKTLLGGRPAVEAASAKPADGKDLKAFAGLIQPMLNDKCVECHGPEKSKGGLRLDSFEALSKGGKSGPLLVAGKAAESTVVKRIHLPVANDDHMPPEGKPQLEADEAELLQWWIDTGATADKKVGDLKATASVARILAARLGTAAPASAQRAVAAKPLPEIAGVAAQLSDDLDIALSALSPDEPWLQCNASIRGTNFGDAELARLAPLGANLRWLDLAGTRVTDAGVALLDAMPNLTRLHLERTGITDAALEKVAGLSNLEYLNLYGTAISDAGLQRLQTTPNLRQVYLWKTRVTPEAAKAFADSRTDAAQLQAWQKEIEQLQARIQNAHIAVDLGVAAPVVATTNTAAMNALCPVSGKAVDPAKTLTHDGSLIAFCCDDCKAKFQQDPKPYLTKLNRTAPTEAK